MDESSFYGALLKLNGIPDHKAAKLFATLYKSEVKVKKLEFELSQINIQDLENEIEQIFNTNFKHYMHKFYLLEFCF